MEKTKSTVINFFGGPGAGKSTSAMDISSYLKKNGHVVEYAHEAAKDMTYSKNFIALSDQLYVLGKQNHKLYRLAENDIDIIVTDSPILLSLAYLSEDSGYTHHTFQNLVLECWNQYNNVCIFMERDDNLYQEYGRSQKIDKAKDIDENIKNMLNHLKIPHYVVKQDGDSIKNLTDIISREIS